jgi:hypothetical protein
LQYLHRSVEIFTNKHLMAKNTNSYHVDPVVHKPSCLKQRRLSDTTTTTLLPNLPKNNSLDDVSSTSSCYSNYAGSLDSSLSDDRRKSVSFADSVGEDLCHVKVFSKELCEYDDQQVSRISAFQSSSLGLDKVQ